MIASVPGFPGTPFSLARSLTVLEPPGTEIYKTKFIVVSSEGTGLVSSCRNILCGPGIFESITVSCVSSIPFPQRSLKAEKPPGAPLV